MKYEKSAYRNNRGYEDPHGTSCTVSGVIDSGGMDIFPAYHWEKFGFSLIKQDKEKDTYVFDFDSATPLVKEVWSLVDEDGDKKLTDEEFRHAAHNKYKTDRLSKLICYHRSEWSYNDAQAWTQLEADLKSRFDKQIQKVKVFCSWKVIAGKYERLLTSEKSSSISLGHYEQLRFFSDRHFWKSRN